MGQSGWAAYAPFITVFGPIIGALIGVGVTYFLVVKRKRVRFSIAPSEDIAQPVQRERKDVVFKVGSSEMRNLNRATIVVRNIGNSTVDKLDFSVGFETRHENVLIDRLSDEKKLCETINIEELNKIPDLATGAVDMSALQVLMSKGNVFRVQVPFFNVKEIFKIIILFDGALENALVLCRMPEVVTRIRVERPDEYFEIVGVRLRADRLLEALGATIAIAVAAIGAALASISGKLF